MGFISTLVVLFLLSLGSLFGTQTKARDTERNTDIKALHGQVEAYYAQNGRYPTLDNMNDSVWRRTNMQGLDDEALKDPDGSSPALKSEPTATEYGYHPQASDDTECDNYTKDCAKYTLSAKLSDGNTFDKHNLN